MAALPPSFLSSNLSPAPPFLLSFLFSCPSCLVSLVLPCCHTCFTSPPPPSLSAAPLLGFLCFPSWPLLCPIVLLLLPFDPLFLSVGVSLILPLCPHPVPTQVLLSSCPTYIRSAHSLATRRLNVHCSSPLQS